MIYIYRPGAKTGVKLTLVPVRISAGEKFTLRGLMENDEVYEVDRIEWVLEVSPGSVADFSPVKPGLAQHIYLRSI